MFNLGLETDFKSLAASGRTSSLLCVTALVCPFIVGVLVSWGCYHYFDADGPFSAFAVFFATCVSITVGGNWQVSAPATGPEHEW